MHFIVGLVVLLLCAHQGLACTSHVEAVQGGSHITQTGSNFYGNNVTVRRGYFPFGAKKSYIDLETKLPRGILIKYYFYVENISYPGSTTFIRLQIWRPFDVSSPSYAYQLVWEKRLEVAVGGALGTLYTVSLCESERIQTAFGDVIGWTNEGNFGTISLTYVVGHKNFFREVKQDDYPLRGRLYVFDVSYLHCVFSVGVEINTMEAVQG